MFNSGSTEKRQYAGLLKSTNRKVWLVVRVSVFSRESKDAMFLSKAQINSLSISIQPPDLGSPYLNCCLAIHKSDSGDLPRFTTVAIESCIKSKTIPILANLRCTNSGAFLLHRSTGLELFQHPISVFQTP